MVPITGGFIHYMRLRGIGLYNVYWILLNFGTGPDKTVSSQFVCNHQRLDLNQLIYIMYIHTYILEFEVFGLVFIEYAQETVRP